ncbi:MAG: metalloregulator ArsR/SmtB family transcription factor [Actinomycetota bacterium]|nr:metalloregulator ArsR/SmtB family transcription factor [Actinomycetota bacterium]
MEHLLGALRAIAEPTRLRSLHVLSQCELTVGELCRVLGQSQPRVSRHLKVLTEAGLLDRQSQGTSVFYRPARDGVGRQLLDAVLDLVIEGEQPTPAMRRDLDRLASVRADRDAAAAAYFESIAADWDAVRALHISDEAVEAALLTQIGNDHVGTLLDIGTGTGRVLELLADRIDFGIGVDLSTQMLNVARSRLDDFAHCTVRRGDVYNLDVEAGSVDVAVLHHVLHFLEDPAAAVAEAAHTLAPTGRLLVVDFAPHGHEQMRREFGHRWLGFESADIRTWCEGAGLELAAPVILAPASSATRNSLTTVLWSARPRRSRRSPESGSHRQALVTDRPVSDQPVSDHPSLEPAS